MLNTNRKYANVGEVIEALDVEARSIRGRVGRASASSQRIMSSEAAAYERVVRMLQTLAPEVDEVGVPY